MADTKISDESAASALTGSELFLGVQSGANVKVSANQIKAFAAATKADGSGTTVNGDGIDIGGSLSTPAVTNLNGNFTQVIGTQVQVTHNDEDYNVENTAGGTAFFLDEFGIEFIAGSDGRPIKGNADYSGSATDNDYIQKKYVDDLSDSTLTSANSYTDSSIDSAIQGLQNKADVRGSTTTTLPAWTQSGTYQVLTANVNGAFPVTDGLTYLLNEDIVVKDETDQKANGIYRLTQLGSVILPWVLTRRSDTNTGTELRGAVVSVDEGTTNADTTWRQTADNITIGTTNIVWVQYGAAVPDATPTTKGKAKLYNSLGTNTDGAIDQATANTNFGLKEDKTNKDATGGYAGLTLFKINFKNALNTFTSFFTNANTAARTYTFPDKNMTVADNADIPTAAATGDITTGTNTTKFLNASLWTWIKTQAQTITAKWTFTNVNISGQAATSTNQRPLYIDSSGDVKKSQFINLDETNKKSTQTGKDNLNSVNQRFENTDLAALLEIFNVFTAQFYGTIAFFTVPSTITAGNAGIVFRDITGVQYRLKDDASNDALTFEKDATTSKKLMRAKRAQYRDQNLGFEVITDQYTDDTTTTNSAQNTLLTIAIPTDKSLTLKINIAKAYATDGSVVDGFGYFTAKNVAGTVTIDATGLTNIQSLGTSLTGNFNASVSGTNVLLRFQNEAVGKSYRVSLDYTFILASKP